MRDFLRPRLLPAVGAAAALVAGLFAGADSAAAANSTYYVNNQAGGEGAPWR